MDPKFSYRAVAIQGASPVKLVICLYEQAIEDLRQAVIALEKGEIEARTRKINHAIMVLGQLQGSLDMQRGGEVARNLEHFYAMVRAGLCQAQLKQSTTILEQQISHLVSIYEAWLEVERIGAKPSSQSEPGASSLVASGETSSADWSA